MASYKYQLNTFGGAAEGYVKYNISPDAGICVAPGESVTVTGQAYRRDAAIYGVTMALNVGEGASGGWVEVAQKAVKIAKGRTGTFTLTFTLPQAAANLDKTQNRKFTAWIEFTLADTAELNGGIATMMNAAQSVTILKSRENPVIQSTAFSDDTSALSHFGAYVQSESQVRVNIALQTDSLDPTTSVTGRELTLGGTVYNLTSNAQTVGTVSLSGTVPWTLKVTDNRGKTAESAGTIQVLPYAPPEIFALTAQRYKAVTGDDGSISYVVADDGEHVRFTLSANVAAAASANAWTLKVVYDATTLTPLTGMDGQAITLTDDRTLVTATISPAERKSFEFTLTDFFHSTSMTSAVDKAGAYFDIEKYGVAVGMRSTGTMDAPLFESAYPGKFYAGLDAAVRKRVLTDADFSEYFQSGGADFQPILSRFGPLVLLTGACNVKKASSGTGQVMCITLPDWAVPATCMDGMEFGSGTYHWRLRVHTDGHVYARKYLTSNGSVATPAVNDALNLSIAWIAADAQEV